MKIINWFKRLIVPEQKDEVKKRQGLILNILLFFSLVSFFFINVIRIFDVISNPGDRGLSLSATLIIFIFFAFLLWLSHQGKIKAAASLLIITFALPMLYSFLAWGADLPAALLLAVLVITLSGVLLGGRMAFISTSLISLYIIVLTDKQARGLIKVASYWRSEQNEIGDAVVYAILLSIIAAVAWLFCQSINNSLKRAVLSERLLMEERDSLEIKVEERTKELRGLEAEKINQLYRLAEFGRLSSGIFHDLINPLTAVSLNLEQIKTESNIKIMSAKSNLNQALVATGKMEDLIACIKKQLNCESTIKPFSLNEEIRQIILILSYKARRAQVDLRFMAETEIEINGDAVKFGQIIINLIANAIEACEETDKKEVEIKLFDEKYNYIITVSDTGSGVAPENIHKIFMPFFSTKKINAQGLGIGLASTKNIVEKNFSGSIEVASEMNYGATFTITIPKLNEEKGDKEKT